MLNLFAAAAAPKMAGFAITGELLFFAALAGLAMLSAVGVVAFNNAVRSALCLVLNFFVLAGIYFTLNAEMMGITQVVVYTGAIMVLFLFVIMLLNLSAPALLQDKNDPKTAVGMTLGMVMFTIVALQVLPGLMSKTEPGAVDGYGSPVNVGRALFTGFVIPFEAVSILLLIGIVGSILLAKRRF